MEKSPLIYGHRGCPTLAPENTLASFSEALNNFVPAVELDVHICRTGQIVVIHDNNLRRITGREGKVSDSDYSLLKSLDAGSHFSKSFKNERIPLLEEVLELLGDKVFYDIELKSESIGDRGLEKGVFSLIQRFKLEDKVMFSSFNPFSLRRISKICPPSPRALIYGDLKELPLFLRKGEGRFISPCDRIKPDQKLIDKKLFDKLSLNYEVMTWTVDDDDRFRALSHLGVRGICTNRADHFSSREFINY